MQDDPLLEQLDWVFTSANWTSLFPNTQALVLARNTSDHAPIKIQIATSIPKSNIFRFENYWIHQEGFFHLVANAWRDIENINDQAKLIAAKFKRLCSSLKRWSSSLAKLSKTVESCNKVILFLDKLEELRLLCVPELKFRLLVKARVQR